MIVVALIAVELILVVLLLRVVDFPAAIGRVIPLEELRWHNTLEPELLGTYRVLLRWSEREGSGLYNPDAEIRETHYDPLPLEIQGKVTTVIDTSPWPSFIRKLVMTNLTRGALAEQLGMAQRTFYAERKNALWYCRGRFEGERIYG